VISIESCAFFLAGPLADRVFEPLLPEESWIRVIGVGPGRGAALLLMLNGACAFLIAVGCYFNRHFLNMEDELSDAMMVLL
jgi:DHA3 family macrolide efflux protein-like MFS transporter